MKTNVSWTTNMVFKGQCDQNTVAMDAKAPLARLKDLHQKN